MIDRLDAGVVPSENSLGLVTSAFARALHVQRGWGDAGVSSLLCAGHVNAEHSSHVQPISLDAGDK